MIAIPTIRIGKAPRQSTPLATSTGSRYRLALSIGAMLLNSITQAQVPDTLAAFRDASQVTRMSIHINGGLYAGGALNTSTPPGPVASGAGARLLWYPEKAAFRAGNVYATQWDDFNIGWWSVAMGEDTRASGDYSLAFGKLSQALQLSAIALGEQNTASGAASIALGYHAHTNARQGSFVFADRSIIDTLRAGVNHSANWRVSGGFRIFTSSNLSTGITLQSGASVSNWGQANAVISTSTGALLTTAGVWQNASDVHRKHLFEQVEGEALLEKVRRLPVRRWSYLSEPDNIKHIGPTAQDFYAAFGLGTDEKSIGTVDADGVALASIQALEARTRQQASELEAVKAANKALTDRLDMLESYIGRDKANIPITIAGAAAGLVLLILIVRRRVA